MHVFRMMRFWPAKRDASQPASEHVHEKPSDRLVDQRLRNWMMDEIWGLSRGDTGVAESGPTEWFETFFDFGVSYEGDAYAFPAMTAEEVHYLGEVVKLMQQAIADPTIPKQPTVDQVTLSGWPRRVAPVAKQALDRRLQRGRFSEDVEEEEPSTPIPWP